MPAVRILIVDDHRAFSEALAARLDLEEDLEVVGTAGSAADAMRLARGLGPDIVTVDVDLGEDDGIALSAQLAGLVPRPRVVMVSCVQDVARTVAAVRTGSVVWVAKDAPSEELVAALRGASRGEGYLPPALLPEVLRELVESRQRVEAGNELLGRLTARELEVMQCLVDGLDRAAIAAKLYLTTNTVRTHVQNALAKLGAHSSLEAVALARQCGLQPQADRAGQRMT